MKNKTLYLFLVLSLTLLTCKKKEDVDTDKISFEIQCEDCSITYTGEGGKTESQSNIKGTFKKMYMTNVDIEITVKVKTKVYLKFILQQGGTDLPIYSNSFTQDSYVTYSKETKKINSGSSTPPTGGGSNNSGCGIYNGKSLYLGPQGGCYYLNSSGNKSYVDRSYCKCN